MSDPCSSLPVSDYSTAYHVGGVFIILAASLLGTALPLLFKRFPRLLKYPFLILFGKHIGTGVLIALSLIHLLAPAFDELGNACLPTAFSVDYEYAPLFAMLAALMMHLIETVALQITVYSRSEVDEHVHLQPASQTISSNESQRSHYHSTAEDHHLPHYSAKDPPLSPSESSLQLASLSKSSSTRDTSDLVETGESAEHTDKDKDKDKDPTHYPGDPLTMKRDYAAQSAKAQISGTDSPKHSETLTNGNGHSHPASSIPSPVKLPDAATAKAHAHSHPHSHEDPLSAEHKGHIHGVLLSSSAERTIGAYILEFGLTAHSVIIGITVGVATDSDLNTLLPALTFHQFFEGFALGARLASVGFSGFNEGLLTFIYSVSAPLGIAIGIGINSTYNGNSATALLVQGTFDAVSAGIILYVAFVQMLGCEFAEDFRNCGRNLWKKSSLFVAMYIGAGVMALIGKWL